MGRATVRAAEAAAGLASSTLLNVKIDGSEPKRVQDAGDDDWNVTDDTATFIFCLSLLIAIYVVIRYLLYQLSLSTGLPAKSILDPTFPFSDYNKTGASDAAYRKKLDLEYESSDLRMQVLKSPRFPPALMTVSPTTKKTSSGSFEENRAKRQQLNHRPASLSSLKWTKKPSSLSIQRDASSSGETAAATRSVRSPRSPSSRSACRSPMSLTSAGIKLHSPALLAIEEGFRILKSPNLPKKFNALMPTMTAGEDAGKSSAVRSPKTPRRIGWSVDEGFEGEEVEENKPLLGLGHRY